MQRTLIAYTLMAALIFAGIVIGLHLRRNSRARLLNRQRERHRAARENKAMEQAG